MRKRILGRRLVGICGVLASTLVAVGGCKANDDVEASKAAAPEQTTTLSTGPVVDNKIAKAVANAAKAAPVAQAGDEGPPENGILGFARADAEVAKGAPPKLKLGSSGSEPKVQLGGGTSSNGVPSSVFDKRGGQLDVALRTGASAFPGIAVKLEFAQPASASATPTGTSVEQNAAPLLVTVSQSDLSATQPGQIPPELATEIRKLKGTQLTYQTQDTALVGAPTVVLAKGANPQLDTLIQAAGSGLADAVLSYPKEPVGVGAFWMVTSRERLLGSDVVSYRMVKVVEVAEGKARVEVNTKRYLADGGIGLPGIEDAKVHQFHAESSAQLLVASGQSLPTEGRSQTAIRSLAEIEGQPRPIQIELRSEFAFK